MKISIDKNKAITVALIILGVLGIICLFGFVARQAENQDISQIEQTRDTRLVDRKLAENEAKKLKYFYGIYDKNSYYKAQQELKYSMSDELYTKYFIDMEYESVKMQEVNVVIKNAISQELGDRHFLVKVTFGLTEIETGNKYSITVKVEVKNERIVDIIS